MQFHASCNVVVRAPSSCKLLPKPPCLSWTIYDDRWRPSMSTKHIHIKYPPEFGRNFADRSLQFDAPKSKNVNGSGNVVSPLQPEKKKMRGTQVRNRKPVHPNVCILQLLPLLPRKLLESHHHLAHYIILHLAMWQANDVKRQLSKWKWNQEIDAMRFRSVKRLNCFNWPIQTPLKAHAWHRSRHMQLSH